MLAKNNNNNDKKAKKQKKEIQNQSCCFNNVSMQFKQKEMKCKYEEYISMLKNQIGNISYFSTRWYLLTHI